MQHLLLWECVLEKCIIFLRKFRIVCSSWPALQWYYWRSVPNCLLVEVCMLETRCAGVYTAPRYHTSCLALRMLAAEHIAVGPELVSSYQTHVWCPAVFSFKNTSWNTPLHVTNVIFTVGERSQLTNSRSTIFVVMAEALFQLSPRKLLSCCACSE